MRWPLGWPSSRAKAFDTLRGAAQVLARNAAKPDAPALAAVRGIAKRPLNATAQALHVAMQGQMSLLRLPAELILDILELLTTGRQRQDRIDLKGARALAEVLSSSSHQIRFGVRKHRLALSGRLAQPTRLHDRESAQDFVRRLEPLRGSELLGDVAEEVLRHVIPFAPLDLSRWLSSHQRLQLSDRGLMMAALSGGSVGVVAIADWKKGLGLALVMCGATYAYHRVTAEVVADSYDDAKLAIGNGNAVKGVAQFKQAALQARLDLLEPFSELFDSTPDAHIAGYLKAVCDLRTEDAESTAGGTASNRSIVLERHVVPRLAGLARADCAGVAQAALRGPTIRDPSPFLALIARGDPADMAPAIAMSAPYLQRMPAGQRSSVLHAWLQEPDGILHRLHEADLGSALMPLLMLNNDDQTKGMLDQLVHSCVSSDRPMLAFAESQDAGMLRTILEGRIDATNHAQDLLRCLGMVEAHAALASQQDPRFQTTRLLDSAFLRASLRIQHFESPDERFKAAKLVLQAVTRNGAGLAKYGLERVGLTGLLLDLGNGFTEEQFRMLFDDLLNCIASPEHGHPGPYLERAFKTMQTRYAAAGSASPANTVDAALRDENIIHFDRLLKRGADRFPVLRIGTGVLTPPVVSSPQWAQAVRDAQAREAERQRA